MSQQWLAIRAQEIILNSEGISATQALKMALLERYDDIDKLAEFAAGSFGSLARKLRNATYELPDEPTLFDIPAVIAVITDEGELFIPRDGANAGQVREWARDGQRFHANQRLKFERIRKQLSAVEDIPDETPWIEARAAIRQRGENEAPGDAQ